MSHVDDGALHSYLDGELTPAERVGLEAHVAACAACYGRLAEERALIARASELLGLAQPPERAAPPLHQLRRPRVVWQLRAPLAWAASVVLALGIGYYAGVITDRPAFEGLAARVPEDSNNIAAQTPAAPRPSPLPAQRGANQPSPPREERANAVADKANSNDVATGAVAMAQRSELQRATPSPVMPSVSARPARAEADFAALRDRQVTTEWPVIHREPAREILGTELVGIPGLAVRDIRRSPTGDGVVLVEQVLDAATIIQVYQQRASGEREMRQMDRSAAGAARLAALDRLARFVGPLRVEIAGPLTLDSLNRLLEQVKPLP